MEKIKVEKIITGDLDEFIDRSYSELLDQREIVNIIKQLKATEQEVKDNIATFLSLQEDINYCSKCPGLDKCEKSQRHYQIEVFREGRFIERRYHPCPLLMKKMEIDHYYLVSDFPEQWKNILLKDLKARQARSKFIMEALNIVNEKSSRWLYLTGKHRVGKTFLLVALLNELIEKKKRVALLNSSQRFNDLKELSIVNKGQFSLLMEKYKQVDVLVLDDFGNEFKSDHMRDNIVYPLLLERAKQNKLTFFTSDFVIEEIGELYSYSKSAALRAKQIVNLLKQYCQDEIILDSLPDVY
jgi:primosomal protein DnaI